MVFKTVQAIIALTLCEVICGWSKSASYAENKMQFDVANEPVRVFVNSVPYDQKTLFTYAIIEETTDGRKVFIDLPDKEPKEYEPNGANDNCILFNLGLFRTVVGHDQTENRKITLLIFRESKLRSMRDERVAQAASQALSASLVAAQSTGGVALTLVPVIGPLIQWAWDSMSRPELMAAGTFHLDIAKGKLALTKQDLKPGQGGRAAIFFGVQMGDKMYCHPEDPRKQECSPL